MFTPREVDSVKMSIEINQNIQLAIPFFKQTETGYCHPACVKMVIDFAIDELGVKQKRLSLRKIADALQTHKYGGTVRNNIELINSLLADSVPQIRFQSQVLARFDDIKKEIDEGRPVIAWIDIAPSDEDILKHAVIVKCYDLQKGEIKFVDPEMTLENHVKTMKLGVFVDEKLGVEGRITKLIISPIGQKNLIGRIKPYERRRKTE